MKRLADIVFLIVVVFLAGCVFGANLLAESYEPAFWKAALSLMLGVAATLRIVGLAHSNGPEGAA
jgi:hypothetical protein